LVDWLPESRMVMLETPPVPPTTTLDWLLVGIVLSTTG
jgi:hypothetical protein